MPTDHKRARLESRRTDVKPTWARVKASLEKLDRIGLMALIHDLYEIDGMNRRVLHERFASSNATFQRYRDLVRAAVFPLGHQPVRLREAAATIREYQRATGNLRGTVDLMLDFVEAGRHRQRIWATAMTRISRHSNARVNEIVGLLDTLPPRNTVRVRGGSSGFVNIRGRSAGAIATF